jgi:hypothetical protein
LARANSAHAEQLLATLRTTPLSTRQLAHWFAQYQRASRPVRERMNGGRLLAQHHRFSSMTAARVRRLSHTPKASANQ